MQVIFPTFYRGGTSWANLSFARMIQHYNIVTPLFIDYIPRSAVLVAAMAVSNQRKHHKNDIP